MYEQRTQCIIIDYFFCTYDELTLKTIIANHAKMKAYCNTDKTIESLFYHIYECTNLVRHNSEMLYKDAQIVVTTFNII